MFDDMKIYETLYDIVVEAIEEAIKRGELGDYELDYTSGDIRLTSDEYNKGVYVDINGYDYDEEFYR